MNYPKYTTQSLFFFIALVAFMIGLWKWFGGLVPALFVFATMYTLAARQNGLKFVITPDGITWLGGSIVALAGFFRYAYGPWGVELKSYSLVHNLSVSLQGVGWLTSLWPSIFGIVTGTMAYVVVISHFDRQVSEIRYRVLLLTVGIGVALHFQPIYAIILFAFVIATYVVIKLCREHRRKAAAVQLLGMLLVLPRLNPIETSVSVREVFNLYGPGYWMLVLGTGFIIFGSVRQCCHRDEAANLVGDTESR